MKATITVEFEDGKKFSVVADEFTINMNQETDPFYAASGECTGYHLGNRHIHIHATEYQHKDIMQEFK